MKAIFFNIFGGITRCDVVARGIIEARKQIQVNVPMVIRLVGTNQEEGRQILAEADITALETMGEAARAAVAAAEERDRIIAGGLRLSAVGTVGAGTVRRTGTYRLAEQSCALMIDCGCRLA